MEFRLTQVWLRRLQSAAAGLIPTLRRFTSLLLLVLAVVHAAQQPTAAEAHHSSLEYEVKAAFLLNFTKFIEWPTAEPSADGAFNICIWGEDPFGTALDQIIQNEKINGRPLAIQRLGRTPFKGCRILYIDRNEKEVKEILGTMRPGVLTVGEGERFLKDGGMIAFVVENRRVRFGINLSATRSASLTLSSRLLSVARSVDK
jgi:hypothetical protein